MGRKKEREVERKRKKVDEGMRVTQRGCECVGVHRRDLELLYDAENI